MAEYIEREALKNDIAKSTEPFNTGSVFRAINRQIAADVEPVVPARWKYYKKQNIAVCTNCSFERDLDLNFGRAISCPNCGAKMDRSSNEE